MNISAKFLPDLSRQDDDLNLISVAPLQKLVALHRALPVKKKHFSFFGNLKQCFFLYHLQLKI